MPNIVVVGTQWGDEGKGKYVDLLSERVHMVVRYGGGHNAGHTVVIGKQQYILHLIPSGILHPGVTCVIGSGCVVDPEAFLQERKMLQDLGLSVDENLYLSDRAHVILPYHRRVEAVSEKKLGDRKIGTTCRGIGPAYEDKVARRGIRIGDLRHPEDLKEKLGFLVAEKNTWIAAQGERGDLDANEIFATLMDFSKIALPHVTDTSFLINKAMESDQSVLFEGAQATLLDIDYGTYPFVTSSSATAAGAAVGSGISPKRIDYILGVTKAYITRVGGGPMITEMSGDMEEEVRQRGAEFGASTGRPRRCGWFDSVVVRYANRVNGLDALAITKLDVLDDLDEIQIGTSYRYRGEKVEEFPGELSVLVECKPEYRTVPGWKQSTKGVTRLADLPTNARKYLENLEELCGVPIEAVSTGADRDSTILDMDNGGPLLERWFGTKNSVPRGAA